MALRHRCAQCGASCQGLRVRLAPDERHTLIANAERLGVERPLSGDHLRHNWGTCVFWADGCRLHAELGPEAKPRTCRQFPFVFATDAVGLDPACFHADPAPTGEAPEPRIPVVHATLPAPEELPWDDLGHGRLTAARLRALPLAAMIEGPRLGTLTRKLLEGLDKAEPACPTGTSRTALAERARTVLQFGLAPPEGLAELLVGGGQLIVGARLPTGAGFAAWVRLLRTGVV